MGGRRSNARGCSAGWRRHRLHHLDELRLRELLDLVVLGVRGGHNVLGLHIGGQSPRHRNQKWKKMKQEEEERRGEEEEDRSW